MDIAAHALWTAAAAIGVRPKISRPIHLGWAVFWGVFPDLFTFTIPAVVRIWWLLTGATASLMPEARGAPRFQFVWHLYHASHSVVVWAIVFGLVWLLARRPVFELLGWALHIAIDIATHQGMFAIHFLWPLSSYALSGTPWESRYFLIANYAALTLVYAWMGIRRARTRRENPVPLGE